MVGPLFWHPATPALAIDCGAGSVALPFEARLSTDPFPQNNRQRMMIGLAGCIAALFLCVGLSALNFWANGISTFSGFLELFLAVPAIVFLWLLVWGYRNLRAPGLVGIRIDQQALGRELANGRRDRWGLRDRRPTLVLLSANTPVYVEGYRGLDVLVSFSDGPSGWLSLELGRSLLSALQTSGLRITKKRAWQDGWGPSTKFLVAPAL